MLESWHVDKLSMNRVNYMDKALLCNLLVVFNYNNFTTFQRSWLMFVLLCRKRLSVSLFE